MNLSTKTKVIISIVVVLTAFASGRFSATSPPSKTTETVKTDTKINDDKDTKTTTVTEKQPNGAEKTTIVTETIDKVTENQDQTKNIQTVVSKPSTLNISVLGANDFSRGILPTYGLSVSNQLIGPVRIGAFGLMNGVIGVSIGLDF